MKSLPTAVTLKDVAEKSGVSITTASRILNNRESGLPIREQTRQRVLTTAAELGYKPNLLARGLRGSNSSLIGVIARDISDPFHIKVLRGINDAAAKRSYRLFLGHVDYQSDVAIAYASMFEQSHADGIIVIGDIEGDEAVIEVLMAQHRYIVGATDRIARRQFPGVYIDNVLGTRLALDHLWNLGHRNIICVSYPDIEDGSLRADVYRQFMQDHGAGDKVRVCLTSQDLEPSYQMGREIFADFNAPGRPTAIFAASDAIAIGLLQAAFQTGMSVPAQVSIVGFDNLDITPFTIPPLTTISQSGLEMGRTAANLLLDMIEQNQTSSEVDDVILRPTLLVRQSTAAPPLSS
ncbi:MAG: LacI family transcriptional regulator [Anaerolineae bacterium]|nr:LacI family transcriptional regulator [Anaerolineae bacterium]